MKKKNNTIYIADPLFKEKNFYNLIKNKKKYKLIFNKSGSSLKDENLNKVFEKNKNICGIIAGLENYNKKTLKYNQKLKVISRVGVGIDSIDQGYLKKKKIKLIKLKNELTNSVAELFLTLILNSLRKIIPNYELLKKKVWQPIIGNNLIFKKIGIIGYGKIGKKINQYLKIFNCKIYIFEKRKLKNKNLRKATLNTIFTNCDIVCIVLNLNKSTKNIINFDVLKRANSKIKIINASRGAIINESDLYNFLKKNKLAEAYLDCFSKEPYKGSLIKLKNVYPLPHIASYTNETRRNMEISASKSLINYLDKINNI